MALSQMIGGTSLKRLFSRRRWLVIGDSHVQAIKWASKKGLLSAQARFRIVQGATATGLRNPNSTTNALELFAEMLLPRQPRGIPVILLGEVDCGFVIWWRARHRGDSVERQLLESIAAYAEFVDRLIAGGYARIVITGATLPTIRDGQTWGEVANKRSEIEASLVERTELTLRYNERLRCIAADRGLPFIDLSPAVLDSQTGLVSERFLNSDPLDHHLDPEASGRLWASALNSLEL